MKRYDQEILSVLQRVWKKMPEQRLGQLLINAIGAPARQYNAENAEIIDGLRRLEASCSRGAAQDTTPCPTYGSAAACRTFSPTPFVRIVAEQPSETIPCPPPGPPGPSPDVPLRFDWPLSTSNGAGELDAEALVALCDLGDKWAAPRFYVDVNVDARAEFDDNPVTVGQP